MLARSHVALAVAPYVALLAQPGPLGDVPSALLLPLPVQTLNSLSGAFSVGLSVGIVGVAALLPDLDHGGSALARGLGPPGRLLAGTLEATLGHRGPLHSVLAALLVGLLAALLGALLLGGLSGLGMLVGYGYLSHVLADALTDRGVPLGWPLIRRRLRLPYGLGPATGGVGEALLVGAALLACGGWLMAGGPLS